MKIENVINHFPQVTTPYKGQKLIYLDSAASTLKLKESIDLVDTYYNQETANIHRGVHTLSEVSSAKYEATRTSVKNFINAKNEHEVIFTKGTTDSINLVAHSFGSLLEDGDEIIITEMEHHSNIVPWQLLQNRKKITLKVVPVDDEGNLIMEEYKKLLSEKTKLVSFVYISNTLGTINPAKEIIQAAKDVGAKTLVDAAQAIAHKKIDVQELDCDFLAFSSHKLFGPTGVGVLYGKEEILEKMPPFMGGGDMIDVVTFEKTTYNSLPFKFEAGTPHIAGVIGLKSCIDFVNELGFEAIQKYEDELLDYANSHFKQFNNIRIIGNAKNKTSLISFVMDDLHAHDIGSLLNKDGIAVRTGHHCTQPLMKRYGVAATARASFSIYNTKEDIDALIQSLNKITTLFT